MIQPIHLIKHSMEISDCIKTLTTFKYSGSFETKIDLDYIMRLLTNQLYMINELDKENKKLQTDLKNLEEKTLCQAPQQ